MSNGNTCTADEQALFISSHGASIVCLTRGDSIGLTLVAESGFISLVAVLAAFTLIFVCIFGLFIPFAKLNLLWITVQCISAPTVNSSFDRYIYGERVIG